MGNKFIIDNILKSSEHNYTWHTNSSLTRFFPYYQIISHSYQINNGVGYRISVVPTNKKQLTKSVHFPRIQQPLHEYFFLRKHSPAVGRIAAKSHYVIKIPTGLGRSSVGLRRLDSSALAAH